VAAQVCASPNAHNSPPPGYAAAGNWGRSDLLAILSLIAAAVAVFWRLALTDLIIGRGDLFFYFYPYRDFASAAAQAGRVPLWNPYLFMGVPFLANSQAGFFYPLNLALAGLPVERMVNASIVLHAALAATGAYLWGRFGLGLGRTGAWLSGLCYGVGGYYAAQVEHLNQVQALAWLPWLLWLYPGHVPGVRPASWPIKRGLWFSGMALVIAMQFLAGHVQSVFICIVGLAGYAVLPLLWDAVQRRASWREVAWSLGAVVAAAALGGALAAVQLLPTFELSRLSVRSGGLPFNEAVSFSLRPGLVGRALLPSWGPPLFPEFVAYVGVLGLGLALAGALSSWRPTSPSVPAGGLDPQRFPPGQHVRRARRGALLLAVLGLFMAVGGFNPLYILLVKLVPGFGLFRAPARWLALYAAGVSGLVGVGLETIALLASSADRSRYGAAHRRLWTVGGGGLAGLLVASHLLGADHEPDLAPPLGMGSVVGWLVAALFFGALLVLGLRSRRPRSPRVLTAVLILLVSIELYGGSLFLPFNRATAPGGLTSLRPAPAHLLAEANAAAPGPPARFLSISDIFFDPGDKPEIEIALQQLSDDALYDYIIATKQKEVLIPNLPLYYRLPAVDGYDGGVLPLRRYVTLERLYMPQEQVAIDGRLRENLETVPDGRWLSLFNVRYVITDKVQDAWFDDVFYDMQMGATLSAGDAATVGYVPSLAATALGVVYQADGAAAGITLADVELTFTDGQVVSLPLVAEGVGAEERVTRLKWDRRRTPAAVSIRGLWVGGQVIIRGLSLIDEPAGVFQPLVLSDSGRYRLVHSGDVKIYENLDLLPRVFFVNQSKSVPDDETALAVMREAGFDPSTTVVLGDGVSPDQASHATTLASASTNEARTELILYEPEHVVATVSAPSDGWLLLSDTWYPGWEATVDGEPAPLQRADILFRAVAVPAGEHRVEWIFRPRSYRQGVVLSGAALGVLLAAVLWQGIGRTLLRKPWRSSS